MIRDAQIHAKNGRDLPVVFSTFHNMLGPTCRICDNVLKCMPEPLLAYTPLIVGRMIKADVLIPGDGEPFRDTALVMHDKLIAWVGSQAALPPEYSAAPHRAYT